jgi:toxin-antitoxin system PIN domain toxin
VNGVALLDVNLLIALFDSDHVHHEPAHDWFADHHTNGWATCALTQNGFVRILANPRYPATVKYRPAELLQHLQQFCGSTHHVFWGESVSLTDTKIFKPAFIGGHRQVSDVYLLGLAKKMRGYLATFDAGIPLGAVVGATRDTIAVIAAGDSDE